jgi:XTP/dITP diphosphohydrolase
VTEPDRPPLVVASTNRGKIAELTDLLAEHFTVLGRPDDLADTVEDGDTLQANAEKKAAEVATHTGHAALADDTGLFVEALGGRPGVWTARYAGPNADDGDNRAKLLEELTGVAEPDRTAEFRTVVALVRPDGGRLVADGRVAGRIAQSERGKRGFGYDPLFVPDEGDGRTFAEMTREDKHQLSHRARALAALLSRLDELAAG